MTLQSTYTKALTHVVISKPNGRYQVVNNQKGVIYDVTLRGKIRDCTCPHGYMKSSPCCSHLMAAARVRAGEKGYRVVEVVRQDEKPEGRYFRLNFNTYLRVELIPEVALRKESKPT